MHEIFDNKKLYKKTISQMSAETVLEKKRARGDNETRDDNETRPEVKKVRFEEEEFSTSEKNASKLLENEHVSGAITSSVELLNISNDDEESDYIEEVNKKLFQIIVVIFQVLESHGYNKMPVSKKALVVFNHKVHSPIFVKATTYGFILEYYSDALIENDELINIKLSPNSETTKLVISGTSSNVSPLSITIKKCLIEKFREDTSYSLYTV